MKFIIMMEKQNSQEGRHEKTWHDWWYGTRVDG